MKRLLVLVLVASGALADDTLTLRSATEQALGGNPSLAGVDARRSMAEAGLREARAAWLPRLSASETMMRSNNPVFVFGSLLEQGRFGAANFDPAFLNDPDPLGNFRLALDVRYTLFDQFRRRNVIRQARNSVEQAGFGGEEARQRIRAEVISRFYGVLLAEQKRDVAAESVRTAEADAAAMRDRYEQGLLVESDLLAAEVQLASFRQSLIAAEGDAAIARAALRTVLHREDDAFRIEGTIPERELTPSALEESVRAALESRGEVRAAATAAENASIQVETARGTRLPRADAFASFGASSSSLRTANSDHAIGLVIGVDLFDPARDARIDGARAAAAAAQAEAAAVRDRITMEVVTAWHRAHSARERIGVAAKSVASAETADRIVRDRYEHGLTTITEHLRAQTALLAARLELLAARYDAVVQHAELLRATGGLHDVEVFQ